MSASEIKYTDGGDFEATMEQIQMAVGLVKNIADILHSDPSIQQFNIAGNVPNQIREVFPKKDI